MPPCSTLLQGLYVFVSLSLVRATGALDGCKIGIVDLSDPSYGLPKCDVNERVRSSGGVVIAYKPDWQAESHQYSQASGPYWLYESIKASPYYTADLEAATVVYVYDYCIQSWEAAAAFGGGFQDGIDPGLVLSNSYTQVLQSRRWRRHGGADHVFFAAHPLTGPSHSYEIACDDMGRANHLVVESAQRLLCKEEAARRSFMVVPYSSPLFADQDLRASPPPENRDISMFFRAQCASVEAMSGNDAVYGLRMRRHMVDAVQSAQDPHASVHCTQDVGRMPYDEMLATMQRSTFCLMPPGETASSRRLTDAVLSGCIPVFIGPPWHEMPLPEYVNYSEFAVFVVAQQPRNLYGGMDIGRWASLEASPHEAVINVYDPIFWFPAFNVSEVAIPVEDLAQLPEKLRELPEEDVRRRQARLAEAQPLFRYRRRPEELDLPGRVTASDAIMEEMCRAGASVAQAAAAEAATPSAARSAAGSPAKTATQSAVESATPPTPLQIRHVERPRQYIHKAGQYMRQAMRNSLGHLQ